MHRQSSILLLWISTLFTVMYSTYTSAQDADYRNLKIINPPYIEYGIKDGLPSNFISHLFNDSKGILWISTGRGVCAFDGRDMRAIPSGGMLNDLVLVTAEDPEGNIWCRTVDGRLYVLKDNQWLGHPLNDSLQAIAQKNEPSASLTFDAEGNIYISSRKVHRLTDSSITVIFDVNEAHQSRFKVIGGTAHGAFASKAPEKAQELIVETKDSTYQFTNKFDFSGRSNHTFSASLNRNIAVGVSIGAFQASPEGQYVYKLPSDLTAAFMFDSDQLLWVGTELHGAFAFDRGNLRLHLFPEEKVTAALQDFEGGYWFGMGDHGLRYIPSLNVSKVTKPEVLRGEVFLHAFDDTLYIQDPKGNIFNRKGLVIPAPKARQHRIDVGFYAKDNIIITGAVDTNIKHELWISDIRKKQLKRIKTPIFARKILLLKKDTAIFSYAQMVIMSGVRHKLYTSRSNAFQSFNDALQLNGDTFLVATTRGVLVSIMKDMSGGESFAVRAFAQTLRFTHVERLKDRIICFSPGKPPFLFNSKTQELIPTQLQGLSPRKIIAMDDESLLIGTDVGLSLLYISDQNELLLKNITHAIGMMKNRVTDIQILSDSLYVSYLDVIHSISLKSINQNKTPTGKASIATRLINSEQVNDDTDIFSSDHLQFLVTAVSFKVRDEFQYEFRLLPIDSNWTYSKQRTIDFYRLPAGSYTLELRNGSEVQSATFQISQHFYQNTWFQFIVIVFLTALVILPLYYRQRLKNTRLALEKEKDQLQLQSLTYQLKPHFLFNALSSIQSFILNNDPLKSSEYLSQFALHVRNALNYSAKDNISLTQVILSTENYLELEQMRLNNSFDFKISVDPVIKKEDTIIPVMLLQPYVENAVIHGITNIPYRGFIGIDFSLKSPREIVCKIWDNGAGLDQDSRDMVRQGNGLGTSINRQRIQLINSLRKQQFSVDIKPAEEGFGVVVMIQIPVIHE